MVLARRPRLLAVMLALSAGCAVSDLDYSGRACDRAVDCPAPFQCVIRAGQGTCVAAGLGVPTTDGGACDTANVSFIRDVQPIFTARCTQGGCHSASSPQGEMSLVAPNTVGRLVNRPTSVACNQAVPNVVRVKPGDPLNSMLWRKTGDDPAKCFDQMPFPIPLRTISPCEFSRLEAWIQQGALDN